MPREKTKKRLTPKNTLLLLAVYPNSANIIGVAQGLIANAEIMPIKNTALYPLFLFFIFMLTKKRGVIKGIENNPNMESPMMIHTFATKRLVQGFDWTTPKSTPKDEVNAPKAVYVTAMPRT